MHTNKYREACRDIASRTALGTQRSQNRPPRIHSRPFAVPSLPCISRFLCVDSRLLATQTIKKDRTKQNENQVGGPNEKFRKEPRIVAHGVGDDDEKEVNKRHDQAEQKARGRFSAMRGNCQRDANERKGERGQG